MDTKSRNPKIVKMDIYIYIYIYIQIYQNRFKNAAEEFKAILKYKTKTSCMSKNRSEVSN